MSNPRNNLNLGPSQGRYSLVHPKQVNQNDPNRAVFNGFSCVQGQGCRLVQLSGIQESREQCLRACADLSADAAQYIDAQPGAQGVFYTSPYHQKCSCFFDIEKNPLYNSTAENSQQLFSISPE